MKDKMGIEATKKLMEIYKQKKYYGELKEWNLYGEGRNKVCGDFVNLFLEVKKDTIVDASYTGKGCLVSQVGAEILCEYIQGKTIHDLEKISLELLLSLFPTNLAETRYGCLSTSLLALKDAIDAKFCMNVHKIEEENKMVVSVVDKEIVGKKLKEGYIMLDLSSPYYANGEMTRLDVVLSHLSVAYSANIVGRKIIHVLLKRGVIKKENIKEIQKIPYVFIFTIL